MGRDLLRRTRLAYACLPLLLLVGACGTADQVRPVVIGSYPADELVASGPVQEIRVTYDGPVRILNAASVQIFAETIGFLEARVRQRPGDTNSVYVSPTNGAMFPLDERVVVLLIEGLVVNELDHYAGDPVRLAFTSGGETPMIFGRPGVVTLLDPVTFASLGDVPTPGGRMPVGIVSTIRGTTQRIWVQLADGGGAAESLAWFEPGDVSMTPVTLPAAADLTTSATAITVDPQGTYVYAAYRDTDSEGVRLVRVDTATALPAGHLDLEAVAPGAGTAPVDMRWSANREEVIVMASEAGSGRIAQVRRDPFEQIDRDGSTPGVQGFSVPAGAGLFVEAAGEYWVSRPTSSKADVVNAFTGTISFDDADSVGVNTALLAMPDRAFQVQGLGGYAGDTAFRIREAPEGFFTDAEVDVSDDVGGVDRGATAVVDLELLPGLSRFAVLLDSPGGLLLGRFLYSPFFIVQEDLDPVTAGVQVVDVEAALSGATVIGRTFGAFAP